MSDLYEQDFIGWTEEQARLLRDIAARGTNLPLDWGHLAEEIEDLGKSQYYALASQVARVIEHLLKLEHSPATGPRPGWMETIADARDEIARRLDDDPGLKPRLAEIVGKETPRAARRAAGALARYQEDAGGIVARARTGTIYSLEQILADWLPERPDPS
jgi:hypothetical protein